MRHFGLCLLLSSALLLSGCGDQSGTAGESDTNSSDTGGSNSGVVDAGTADGAGIALLGEGWDGSGSFDPTNHSDKVRVIAFLNPM